MTSTGNGRSQRPTGGTTRRAGSRAKTPTADAVEVETAAAIEPEGHTVAGTSMVMHRFDQGALKGVPWINASGLPVDTISPHTAEIAAALSMWVEDQKLAGTRGGGSGSIFDRNAYIPPENVFDQMRMARKAVENDETVGGLADTTESLAINEIHWESEDLDDSDVMNQWATMVNLDAFIRASWRELFTDAQYVVAAWWGFKDFKVRGRTPPSAELQDDPAHPDPAAQKVKVTRGQRRRKTVTLYCPLRLTHLDSTKVVPVGTTMFGMERLAWCATSTEIDAYKKATDPDDVFTDPMMTRLFIGQYVPSDAERQRLVKIGVNTEFLLEFNSAFVWRCTMTRPDYKPWADLRLKRCFRWLDMKQQLLAADRVALIGNANYILVVTKGDKDNMPEEGDLAALNEQFAYVAKLPIVIGDYTLKVEIVQPKMDMTLTQDKYNTINGSIIHSIMRTFRLEGGSSSSRGDTTLTVGRAIARGLDNVRRMIRRDFEKNLARAIWEHPFNESADLGEEPNLAFSPRNINLDVDAQTMTALTGARASGDLSRRTYLEELGQDEDVEAALRLQEMEYYDLIFRTKNPHDSPSDNPFAPDGGPGNTGGAALPPGAGGGGRPPGSGTGTKPAKKAAAPRPARGKNR